VQSSYINQGEKGVNSVARYFIAIVVMLVFWQIIGAVFYAIPVTYVLMDNNPTTSIDPSTGMTTGLDPLVNYIFLNIMMVFFFIGIFVSIKFIHKRNFKTLITPENKFSPKKFFIGFGVYGFLVILGCIADYLAAPETYSISFEPSRFFIALPIILILTPIQTTAEELFFRGYVLQGFGSKIKNTVILSVISGVIFMLPHLMNPEVGKSLSMGALETFSGVIYYFLVGFIFSIITIKTNSLEVAIGSHMVNNLIGALLVGFSDSVLQTNTIFFTTRFEPVFNLVLIIVTAIVFYYIVTKWIKSPKSEMV